MLLLTACNRPNYDIGSKYELYIDNHWQRCQEGSVGMCRIGDYWYYNLPVRMKP